MYTFTAAVIAGLVVIPSTTYALFGFGDIVEDPWNLAQTTSIAASSTGILGQSVQMVQQGIQSYTLARQMATRLFNKQTYVTAATGLANNWTQNKNGETINWSAVLNGNPGQAISAYRNATTQLAPNVDFSAEQFGASYHLANLATVEAIYGTNQACLQAVGQYAQNQQANQQAFLALNDTTADGSDDTNGTVGQLNVLAAASAQQRAEQVSQGSLQACVVQEQILANKIYRDTQVEALNMYAAVQQKYQSNPMVLTHINRRHPMTTAVVLKIVLPRSVLAAFAVLFEFYPLHPQRVRQLNARQAAMVDSLRTAHVKDGRK